MIPSPLHLFAWAPDPLLVGGVLLPVSPRRSLLSDLYANAVHRAIKDIVEWVRLLGSNEDFFRVGDRAGRARLGVGPPVHPPHNRGARLCALEGVPVPIYDVGARHLTH